MFSKSTLFLVLIGAIVGMVNLYTFAMRYIGSSGNAQQTADPAQPATHIFVDRSDRRLTLYREEDEFLVVPVSRGVAPEGHKRPEGDERTPTGTSDIDWRNPNSIAHPSLQTKQIMRGLRSAIFPPVAIS